MIKVSPSSVGMLLECPRCLWLYFREQVKRPTGPFPSLPGGMDELFKDYFDKYRLKNKLPPEIDGKVNGKLFSDMKILKPWREFNFGRGGIKAEFPEYEILLQGAIDELLINEAGELVPFDFKTRGYPTKSDTHLHYENQLNLYGLLFEKNGYKTADYGYLLFFWPKEYSNGKAKFESEIIKIGIDTKKALSVLKRVYDIVNKDLPHSHKDCEFCLYRNVGYDFEE